MAIQSCANMTGLPSRGLSAPFSLKNWGLARIASIPTKLMALQAPRPAFSLNSIGWVLNWTIYVIISNGGVRLVFISSIFTLSLIPFHETNGHCKSSLCIFRVGLGMNLCGTLLIVVKRLIDFLVYGRLSLFLFLRISYNGLGFYFFLSWHTSKRYEIIQNFNKILKKCLIWNWAR